METDSQLSNVKVHLYSLFNVAVPFVFQALRPWNRKTETAARRVTKRITMASRWTETRNKMVRATLKTKLRRSRTHLVADLWCSKRKFPPFPIVSLCWSPQIFQVARVKMNENKRWKNVSVSFARRHFACGQPSNYNALRPSLGPCCTICYSLINNASRIVPMQNDREDSCYLETSMPFAAN